MRGGQLVRQWKLIKLLMKNQAGLSVLEMSKELKARQRTIYRDLEVIKVAGFVLNSWRDHRNVVYWIERDWVPLHRVESKAAPRTKSKKPRR